MMIEPPTTNTTAVMEIVHRLLDAIDNGDVSDVLTVKGEYKPKDIRYAWEYLNDEQKTTLKCMGSIRIEVYTLEG